MALLIWQQAQNIIEKCLIVDGYSERLIQNLKQINEYSKEIK